MSLRRGSALARQGRYEEAMAAFEEAARARPSESAPLIQKALCHLALGQLEPADACLEQASELAPGNPAPRLFLALTRSERGDQEGAELLLREIKKLCPDHQAVDTVRALINLRKGALESAVTYLGSRPDLSLSSPIISRLVLELEKRLLPGDVPRLRRAAAHLPDEGEEAPPGPSLGAQLRGLPRAFSAWVDQSQGRRQWERGLRYPPGSERRRALLGQAVERLRGARDADPNRFRADFYLGEALLYAATPRAPEPEWLDRLRESRESFLVSWRREGENPYLLYYLGRVSLMLGEVEAAITYFQRGLEKFAKFPEAHYGLGQCWLLKGDLDRAREYFALALGSDTFILRDRLHELVARWQTEPEILSQPMPEWEPEVELDSTPAPVEVPSEPSV